MRFVENDNSTPLGEPAIYWSSYSVPEHSISVPRHVERNAERLRADYLKFIRELGVRKYKGRTVIDHLAAGGGLSYWWMGKVAEKSPFKSNRVYDCIRLMALREILAGLNPAILVCNVQDRSLEAAIVELCSAQGIRVRHLSQKSTWNLPSLRQVYQRVPALLRGLISIRHMILRMPFKQLSSARLGSGGGCIFFCTAFFNLDWEKAARGRFHARQWESLPGVLHSLGRSTNWLHHFLPEPGMPGVRASLEMCRRFNSSAVSEGTHVFLETFLTWRTVLRALKRWIRLIVLSMSLRDIGSLFKTSNSSIDLWPLLKDDWVDSFVGVTAVANCFWIELFDQALRRIPRQNIGLYPFENQAWECAFVWAWRRHGHGEIIGAPHTTTPFWYLNMYDDEHVVKSSEGDGAKPMPDALAVNGRAARTAFEATGYPPSRLRDVEALRFQYLSTRSPKRRQSNCGGTAVNREKIVVIILGDFTRQQTMKLLSCMGKAQELLAERLEVTLKPHPVSWINASDFPAMKFSVETGAIGDLLASFDFAFASNTTSAALDMLLGGTPVAVYISGEDFNHSPLRGYEGVNFVSDPVELAAAIRDREGSRPNVCAEEIFNIDPTLSRWKSVLSSRVPVV